MTDPIQAQPDAGNTEDVPNTLTRPLDDEDQQRFALVNRERGSHLADPAAAAPTSDDA